MEIKFIKRGNGLGNYQVQVNGVIVMHVSKYYDEWVACEGANMFGKKLSYGNSRKEAVADGLQKLIGRGVIQ